MRHKDGGHAAVDEGGPEVTRSTGLASQHAAILGESFLFKIGNLPYMQE
jgi:hypothetical protein